MAETKNRIMRIIPITISIDPITYIILAGSDGSKRFMNNKITPKIINTIPLSNDTILIYYRL